MNDLHALAAFKALDEGRLQPVDKEAVVTVTPEDRKAARQWWLQHMSLEPSESLEMAFARHRHQSETGAALPSDGREVLDGWKMGASDETGPWATSPSQITVSDHMLKSTEALAERVAAMRFTKTISGDPWESDTTVDQIEPNALANTVGPILKAVREMLAALAQPVEAGEDGLREIALTDDPDWICAGIPDDAIEAGTEVFRQVERDNENYIAGEATDWDEGMIAGAIFKAVARSIIQEKR